MSTYAEAQNQKIMEFKPLTLVKAGAGAGKTFRLKETLTQWVLQGRVKPENILAVTYTNAGAAEMRERIRADLLEASLKSSETDINPGAIDNAQISTIHGFGLSLIERFAYKKGISPKPRQLTETEEKQLIKHTTAQLETVSRITEQLDLYGYTGTKNNDGFTSKTDQFRKDVQSIINRLRNLGQGMGDDKERAASSQRLIQAAQKKLRELYSSHLGDADQLNTSLWNTIQSLKQRFDSQRDMDKNIGFNASLSTFVENLYSATPEQISKDWKLWANLQADEKLREHKKVNKHFAADSIHDVWDAAAKLSNHPGPLKQAQQHAKILLEAAFQALNIYQEGKESAGLVDFSDMVHLAEQILADEQCLEELTNEIDCLVIDEFQDTNPLQYALLQHFQKAGVPTFIVGDLKQSIMSFQGADSRIFSTLLKNAGDGERFELMQNWRSTQGVMQFINAMGETLYNDYQALEPKADYQAKNLKPVRRVIFKHESWNLQANARSSKPVLAQQGYDFIILEITKLIEEQTQITDKSTGELRPIQYSDIAILAPSHKRLQTFAKRLRNVGIAAQLEENGWLESHSVQYMLNALQYFNDKNDHFAALSFITSPFENADLEQAIRDFYDSRGHFSHERLSIIDRLKKPENEGPNLRDMPIKTQLMHLADALNFHQALRAYDSGEQQRANLLKLFSLADEFAQLNDATLHAQGIYGKNTNTFCAWLKANASEDDLQPTPDTHSQDAVVLKTWHSAKGLEWPVVVVLDTHEERKAKLPHRGVSYPSTDDINTMLTQGIVDFYPNMNDPKTKDRFLEELAEDTQTTQKNLIYVALTRAREQIILPWYEHKDGFKDNSICAYLAGLFSNAKGVFEYEDITAKQVDVEAAEAQTSKTQLALNAASTPKKLAATVSPSRHEASASKTAQSLDTESDNYSTGLNLNELDGHTANDIGTWIHRLYHVAIKQHSRLDAAMQMPPINSVSDELKQAIYSELTAFQNWLTKNWYPTDYHCELPILAINPQGQTLSGTIDLLVETEQGYWLVDHKTDQQADFAKHNQQLMDYVAALKLDKPVLGVAVNWVRHGIVEQSVIA